MNYIIALYAVLTSFMLSVAGPAQAFDLSATQLIGAARAQNALTLHQVSDSKLMAAESFIDQLGRDAITIMGNTSLSSEQKRQSFASLLQNNFDMNTIGRFTLGRYWRTATKAEQREFLKLFKDMVVRVYSRRFEDYSGQQMNVDSSRYEGQKDIMVNATVISPNGQRVRVDWRVRNRGTEKRPNYKVIDVIVEGISMSLTQRSDFASVIQRGGGSVGTLLVHLGG